MSSNEPKPLSAYKNIRFVSIEKTVKRTTKTVKALKEPIENLSGVFRKMKNLSD